MIKPTAERNLFVTYPEIADQWNYDKNGSLKPEDFSPSSSKKVWWKCTFGHEWESKVENRTRKNNRAGCPYCSGYYATADNNLLKLYPEVAKQWHPTKNGDTIPNNITSKNKKDIWWICDNGHEWVAKVGDRTLKKSNCPYCSGRLVHMNNSLFTIFPEVSKDWHPTKNGKLTPSDITSQNSRKVWWLCSKGHEWSASVSNKTRSDIGCPFCSGKKPCIDNCLATLRQDLIVDWNYDKNINITPYDVTCGSHKTVWWKCANCNSDYDMSIENRTIQNQGCPYCAGRRTNETNSLFSKNPHLFDEWDFDNNVNITPYNVTFGSSKIVWWKCSNIECNFKWKARIGNRSILESGCPKCSKSKGEKIISDFLSKNGIIFIPQYRLSKCRYKNPLPFDFAIFCEIDNLLCTIEYDGEQHYKPVEFGGMSSDEALSEFKLIQKRDGIKTNYCIVNNIPLIRISFRDFNNIEEILTNELIKLNIDIAM